MGYRMISLALCPSRCAIRSLRYWCRCAVLDGRAAVGGAASTIYLRAHCLTDRYLTGAGTKKLFGGESGVFGTVLTEMGLVK